MAIPQVRPGQPVRINAGTAASTPDSPQEGEVVAIRPSDDAGMWLITIDVSGSLEEVPEDQLSALLPSDAPLFPIIIEARVGLDYTGPLKEELGQIAGGAFGVLDCEFDRQDLDTRAMTIASLRVTPANLDSVSGFERIITQLGPPDDFFDDGWSAEAHWRAVGASEDGSLAVTVALRPWEYLRRREFATPVLGS